MPPSEPNTSQDLEFPPVQVDRSLTTLDLETLMMRSTQRRLPEEADSSLEDSTYELLGDAVTDTSDDEAHTASIASTDEPTPDDTSDDFSDDESEFGTSEQGLQDSGHASHGELLEQHADVHPTRSGEDSTLTEVPPYLAGSESSWHLTLDEEPTDKPDVRHGSRIIESLADDTDELPQVLSRYGCAQLRLLAKGALSQHPLPTPDSYKILFLGMPEKWAEDLVVSHIGAALAASPNTSKSVMVRGQIEPYAPVPQSNRCTKFQVTVSHQKPVQVLAILEDGRQIKFGPGMDAHSPDRPDLIIMCHPAIPDSTADEQDFASARKVFESGEIPCIELTEAKSYGTGTPNDDLTSLRVCVEGRHDANTDYELKEVLPLDYYRFSRLEPSQLNRHLALISPHLMEAQDTGHAQKARTSCIGDKTDALMKRAGPGWQVAKTLISALVLFILAPALFHGVGLAPMFFERASNGGVQSPVSSEVMNVIPVTSAGVPSSPSQRIPITSDSSIPSTPRGLTIVPAQKNDNAGGFEIHTTGDHQFVLRPSKAFTSSRKKPQLQIQVCRQSQVIPARYNRTMTGEYIVDLEQQYPFDMFNVSIATHSKPLLRQSFEVRLGHNRSTLYQLLDHAKLGVLSTQHNVWNISTTAVQHMRTFLPDLEINSFTAAERLQIVQQNVQRRIETNARLVEQVRGATWAGLRRATAPVRTSTPMKRARMNALRIRCKMEITAGLSARNVKEKQSWACSKVRGEA
ncbi:hypothetical protein BDW02DRAFT_572319 [Decorospora gaudefroyi]|uniref:Uncharacterized protein n=1 Tax=Decorospora gaudefroyi TaxID=184978 RepID=A0A6A5K4B5_9PLEO|nr:hypothetical protein BDW02DRAFT_572319 [Decorospora gaudefroyi]